MRYTDRLLTNRIEPERAHVPLGPSDRQTVSRRPCEARTYLRRERCHQSMSEINSHTLLDQAPCSFNVALCNRRFGRLERRSRQSRQQGDA